MGGSNKFLVLVLTLLLCPAISRGADHNYVTWDRIEPDNCIAAWLIKSYVDTNAVFCFVPKGTAITNGIAFDVPGAKYARDQRRSTSEAVIEIHQIKNAKAIALGVLARKLELGLWHATFSAKEEPLAHQLQELQKSSSKSEILLEAAFRLLDVWTP